MGNFKGIRKLSQAKYDELKAQGLLDPDIQYVTPTEPYLKKTDVVNNLTSTETQKPLSAEQGKILDEKINALAGQNEYIGSYNGVDYTSSTIQTILSDFVQTTEGRAVRNGDIVNIVNNGVDANYGGQQWIYVSDISQWKYYIDFENHSVIDNLTSQSTTDGLSAKQGNVLYGMIVEQGTQLSETQQDVADNMSDIGTLQGQYNNLLNSEIGSLQQLTSEQGEAISDLQFSNSTKAEDDLSNVTYPEYHYDDELRQFTTNTTTGAGDRVVEAYMSSDGNTWYRKWASGWLECGMKITNNVSGTTTIQFPISFSAIPKVFVSPKTTSTNATTADLTSVFRIIGAINSIDLNSVKLNTASTTSINNGYDIYAMGFFQILT